MSITNKAAVYLNMIKIEHSIFALPFAFAGALLAQGGIPTFEKYSGLLLQWLLHEHLPSDLTELLTERLMR